MKKIFKLLLPLIFLAFANCSDLKKGLGFEKDVPNEFLIRKIDPIERPPNYDLLPPDSQSKKKKDKKVNTSKNTKSIIQKSLNSNSKDTSLDSNGARSSNIEESILKQLGKE